MILLCVEGSCERNWVLRCRRGLKSTVTKDFIVVAPFCCSVCEVGRWRRKKPVISCDALERRFGTVLSVADELFPGELMAFKVTARGERLTRFEDGWKDMVVESCDSIDLDSYDEEMCTIDSNGCLRRRFGYLGLVRG